MAKQNAAVSNRVTLGEVTCPPAQRQRARAWRRAERDLRPRQPGRRAEQRARHRSSSSSPSSSSSSAAAAAAACPCAGTPATVVDAPGPVARERARPAVRGHPCPR